MAKNNLLRLSLISILAAVAAIMFDLPLEAIHAQTSSATPMSAPPMPPATPSPDPTLIELSNQMRVSLTEVALKDMELSVELRDVERKTDSIYTLGGAVATILTIIFTLGLGAALVVFRRWIKSLSVDYVEAQFRTARETTEERLLGLSKDVAEQAEQLKRNVENQLADVKKSNPRYSRVFWPENDLTAEELEHLGIWFIDLKAYGSLSEITGSELRGMIIVKAVDIDRINALARFIEERRADPKRVAFVVYMPQTIVNANAAINTISQGFPMISMANTIVRVVADLHTFANGLYFYRRK